MTFIDIDRAGKPGVEVPRPPQGGQNEHAAQDAGPRHVRREQAGDPGYCEYEDQVEEQSERRDWCS